MEKIQVFAYKIPVLIFFLILVTIVWPLQINNWLYNLLFKNLKSSSSKVKTMAFTRNTVCLSLFRTVICWCHKYSFLTAFLMEQYQMQKRTEINLTFHNQLYDIPAMVNFSSFSGFDMPKQLSFIIINHQNQVFDSLQNENFHKKFELSPFG